MSAQAHVLGVRLGRSWVEEALSRSSALVVGTVALGCCYCALSIITCTCAHFAFFENFTRPHSFSKDVI